jgi:hypothetical protein
MPRYKFSFSERVPGSGECEAPDPETIIKAFQGDGEARKNTKILWQEIYDEYTVDKEIDPDSIELAEDEEER